MRFWTPFSPTPTPSTRSRSPVPFISPLDRRKRAVDRFHRSHRRSDQRRQIPEPRSPRSLLYASLAPSIQTTTPRTCSKGCSTDWGADARRCCADWSLAECAWRPMAASTSARCCRRRRCRSCRNCLLQVVLEGESERREQHHGEGGARCAAGASGNVVSGSSVGSVVLWREGSVM